MKTINALVVLGIASLLSACGGSGSGSGTSSSSVSSLVESVSSQSSAVSVVSSVADVSSSSPAISSADMSSSSLAVSSAAAALYPSYNTNPIAPDMTGMGSNATQLAAKMKLGTNIGNTMEAYGCSTPSETCWGQPMVSAAYVKLVKDSGFDSIRIPVSWDQYADQTTGKISDAWLNRVKEVVQYAVDNGLYVIINIHWDGGWLEGSFHEAAISVAKKEAVKAKQKAYWEQIATHLRDFDEHVLFASANEPDAAAGLDEPASATAPRVAVLNEYHQTFVDAVRSTGGKNAYRVLVIQSPRTDIDLAFNEWHVMPSDTVTGRQMAEVHFYPWSFTLQGKDESYSQVFCYWGEGHHSTTDTYHNSTREEEDHVDAQFTKIKTKFSDQGIPVVLGEFGAMLRPESVCTDYAQHRASRAYYAQYVTQSALAHGMLPFYWEIGVDPALIFDRAIPAVGDQQLLDGLLIGAGKLNGSSSSSQSSSANSSSSSTEISSVSSSSSSSASSFSLAASPDDASSSSLSSSSISVALYPSYNTNPIAPDMTGMDSDAVQIASKIKLGINIGNTLEAYGCTPAALTCWGNPMVSAEYIKLIKDSGFDAVRIPVSWDQYANQETAEIRAEWLDLVKQVVQYSVDNDLYVVVNIHWDGGWLDKNITAEMQSATNAKQKAFWEQIATHLRDFDEHVLFASANEPPVEEDDNEGMTILHSYHQTFVDTVRATGGKNAYRVLVVQGPGTNLELTRDLWQQMPNDTVTGRQMVELHFYGPFNFGLMNEDTSWGKMSYYWGQDYHSTTDPERNATWGEEDWVDNQFNIVKAQFTDNGIPVVMGEYGARYRANLTGDALALHQASHAYFHQYVTQRALAAGALPFLWEQGYDPFNLFDRATPALARPQLLDALLIGAGKMNGSSSSSQSSSSTEMSSASSSSSSSASNNIVLDTSPSNWSVSDGVVKNESATHIQFTLTAENQSAEVSFNSPVNMNGATVEVVLNFDQAFVTNRNDGNAGILQFFAKDNDWGDVGGEQWVCWTGWTPIVADQDKTFTCSGAFNDVPDVTTFGLQFLATAGTVTIKSATIELAE